MKITLDEEAHAAYISLRTGEVSKTIAYPSHENPQVLLDQDQDGNVVGVEILDVNNLQMEQES